MFPSEIPGLVTRYAAADMTGLADGDPVPTWYAPRVLTDTEITRVVTYITTEYGIPSLPQTEAWEDNDDPGCDVESDEHTVRFTEMSAVAEQELAEWDALLRPDRTAPLSR